ncbi:MAG: hypothetical protein NWF04_10360 [Candidatus Bathyarchaeota archaeon]|nr:hypothetical protein [Candidatus Bathyarchaeota archaeon]
MDNWKIIGKIATAFGITCLVFAVVSAFIEYNIIRLTTSFAPASYVQLNVVAQMLPFLLFAALSFIVAGITLRIEKEPIQETQPQEQPQTQETPSM